MGCSFSGLNALYDAVNGAGDVWINENRFRIVRQLGEGGFAFVYLVKELLPDPSNPSGGIAAKIKDSSHISGSSGFGQKPTFGGFGSNTTQSSPFGSSFQQSQPALGSNLFGSSTPFGAPSQPSFGASSTPAFGATSTPAFGSTATPAFGSTSGGFGASGSPFGSSSPAFGASSTPAFGASSTPAFGATAAPAFGATSTPAFGATTTPAFGASPNTAFGASSTPAFNFGSSPSFGQSASAFGSSPFGATSSFGAQSTSFGDGTYAMKKVLIQTTEQLELVREEIRVSSQFSHPNLLPLLDHAIIAIKASQEQSWKHEAYLLFPAHLDEINLSIYPHLDATNSV